MKENASSMDRLRLLVRGCPTGLALLSALEGSSLANGELPGLVADVISESKAAGGPASAAAADAGGAGGGERASLDAALCVIPSLSFVTPRGKQDLALFADHLVVRTAKDDVAVPYSAIQHVAVLDEIPKDAKGRVLLYLHLSGGGVPHRKGRLAALVVQTTAAAQLDIPNPKGNGGRLRDPAAVVLCQALGLVGVAPACFCSPDPEVFRSTSGAAGVEAHVKARPGFLFPMPAGLCFLETPAMFVPIKDIKSVELARANGTSSTFDLYVHLRDGSTVEFGMIERDEAQRVSAYIRAVRLAVGPPQDSDSEEGGGEEGGSEGGADSDSDDPEDEDFNPYASGGKDAKKGAKKRKRLAAGEEDRTTASRSLGTGTSSSSGSEEEGSNASSGSSEEEGEEEEAEEAGERGGAPTAGAKAGAGAPHAAAAQDDAASEELGSTSEEEDEDEEEDEEEEEEEEEEEGGSSSGGSGSDSEDDGSAELVDEEGVSVGALAGAMAAEEAAEGGRAAKKQRR